MTFLVNFVFGRLEKLDGAILGGGGGEGGLIFGMLIWVTYLRGVY